MDISQVNSIAETLAQYLQGRGIVGEDGEFSAIYTNDSIPSNSLPDAFLTISGNGPLTSECSQLGMLEYNLSLAVNLRLRSDGTINTFLESRLVALVEKWIRNVVVIGEFHYSKNKRNLIYSGRSLIKGFSSKIVNINVKIY